LQPGGLRRVVEAVTISTRLFDMVFPHCLPNSNQQSR
jgi:hypothetical protein